MSFETLLELWKDKDDNLFELKWDMLSGVCLYRPYSYDPHSHSNVWQGFATAEQIIKMELTYVESL